MVASLHLESEAMEWHQAFMKYKSYTEPPTWTEYALALTKKFGENYDDHMEELKKIVQTGNVKEYKTAFERSLTRVNLSQENAISCFVGGLKEQLNIVVKMTNPRSLAQVLKATRMQEAYIDAQSKEIVQRISLLSAQTTNFKRNVDQRFQNKPLLALPAPKKHPQPNYSHKCKNLKQVYALEVEELQSLKYSEDAESFEDSEQIVELAEQTEHMEISVHVLNGSMGFKCLRATGYNAKKPLLILIDTGSTHNFINSGLVKQLRCPATTTCSQIVAAANGSGMKVDKVCRLSWLLQGAEFEANFMLLPLANYDVVLGIEWLVTLGDIKMNFKKLTMEFFYKKIKHVLRGAENQIKSVNVGKIAKLSGNQPQLAMIQGIFDHQIILQNGIEHINKRPYRYPAVKMDIIEGLVKQMLDQGIIQPSSSPFASPIILVGKKDGT
ncbi:uncharacterized protein [Nicotiana sylvestris]|uniref:uncharacterized protein n=1 Tax=Nicotiana sylvestris TaxID=4096 RepID=UPI00388C5B24